mgnify:CR=1 FL=1
MRWKRKACRELRLDARLLLETRFRFVRPPHGDLQGPDRERAVRSRDADGRSLLNSLTVEQGSVRRAQVDEDDFVAIELDDAVPLRHETVVQLEIVERVAAEAHRGRRKERSLLGALRAVSDANQKSHAQTIA